MSSAIYLKFKNPIDRKEFDDFCSENEIVFSPQTIGGNVYYYGGYGGVEIVFDESEITVSTFHFTCGGKLPPVAKIAKKIRSKFNGTYSCDPEFECYMPSEFRVEEDEE